MISKRYRDLMQIRESQRLIMLDIGALIGTTGAVYDACHTIVMEMDKLIDMEGEKFIGEGPPLLFEGLTCEHCGRMHDDGPCNRIEYRSDRNDQ